MDFVYRYGDPHKLYINATNRCTNRCSFCVRNYATGLCGATLSGDREPDFQDLKEAIQSLNVRDDIREYIWCGFGEPTFRLDLMVEAAPWLRSGGAKIRLNTNGHASLIHGRDVLQELSQAADEASISLNAPNRSRYLELCRPDLNSIGRSSESSAEIFWDAMIDFLSRAPACVHNVQASVVGYVLSDREIEECRSLSLSLGIKQFLVR